MSSPLTIQRRAIDPSGTLGSFYNGYRDCILKQPNTITTVPKYQLHDLIRCELIKGNTEKSENLLKMIGIEDDFRLNILLKSTASAGIAELVDHLSPTDKYTRFLYIFYADRRHQLDDSTEAKKCVQSFTREPEATHIITAVSFGIDVVVVLQLPDNDDTASKIDVALEKIRARLDNCNDISTFTTDDEDVLTQIIETKAYSNIFELTKMTSLRQICQYIAEPKRKSDTYRSLTYTLRPIEWLYPSAYESYTSIEKRASDNLEHHLIKLSKTIKRLKHWFNSKVIPLHFQHFQEQLSELTNQWQRLQKLYEDVIIRLRVSVSDIHSGLQDSSEIDRALKHEDQTTLNKNIRELMKQVHNLEAKTSLINSSKQKPFEEFEVLNSQVNRNDDEQTLDHQLITENQQNRTVSPNETLIENNQSVLSSEQKKTENKNRQSSTSSSLEAQTTATPSSPPKSEIINVLLLGESGVGKSTFINAFVNYLKFQTFEQAQSSTPVVLIPVSFVIATGNNFVEHTIKFGDSDSLNNEDFDHPGQSVTQNCKSYLFDLDDNKGSKLRIIDTPGFGDTRGIDQDDLNMQHILHYINNLTHLNAVCFLLKPNTSQINNFFRTCLTQLLDLLGPNARQNIIFCFTNARTTFYTPGDTAPLLRTILKSFSGNNIPFNKENTFCFDNESFRYLVALQNSITFDDHEKEEYESSWSKSVKESKSLRDYICRNLTACYMRDGQELIKRAQFEIVHMIRPMLEAMRNILRNIVLWKMDAPNKSIELMPRALRSPATVCLICKRDSIQRGKFWIACDGQHEIHNKSCSCKCASSQHMPIDYQLDYEYSDNSSTPNQDEMKRELSQLRNASVEFAHFLMHVAHSSKDDPFWIGMTQMIYEENDIGRNKKSNMNSQLANDLRNVLRNYEQQIDNTDPNQQHNKLSTIYKSIQTVGEYPAVQRQMEAVRKTQKNIMKLYEYEVPENLASTSVRSTTTS